LLFRIVFLFRLDLAASSVRVHFLGALKLLSDGPQEPHQALTGTELYLITAKSYGLQTWCLDSISCSEPGVSPMITYIAPFAGLRFC